MFLHVSVILFTGGRGVSQHALGQASPLGRHPSMHWGRHPLTTTAVDGTHPTGMHSCLQWQIYIVKFWTRPPPPGSKFFQFHAVFGKIWQNRKLAPPRRVGAPSSGKSWIRHWFRNIFLNCSLYDSSDVASAEEIPAPPNTRASSPTPSVTQEHGDIMLPHAEPIPPEHMVMARQWIPVRLFRNKSFSTY